MKKAIWFLAAAGAFLLIGCGGGMKSALDKGELAPKFEDTKVDGKYLWVRGFGAANPAHPTKTQRRIMSREAAIAMGQQRAVEYIKGSGVIANVKVQDAISKDSTIETMVDGVVKGAEIVTSEFTDDDGCTVVLRIDKEQFKNMNLDLPVTPDK